MRPSRSGSFKKRAPPTMKRFTALLLPLAGAVSAQQQLWGQCGGQGYSGPTTCVSGAVCSFLNEWYSQCTPGQYCSESARLGTRTDSER